MLVFNRWGNEIITLDNYDKNNHWDGRTFDGNNVSDGVYFYILKLNDGQFINGTITITR